MTTLEMEIALLNKLDFRKQIIVPNVSWGITGGKYNKPLHEVDLCILNKSKYCTEVEIKVSKQDLLNDFKKKHKHDHELIKYLYYAVPPKLKDFALTVIPDRAGLYVVNRRGKGYQLNVIRKATRRVGALKWTEEQERKLLFLASMRIYSMKKTILKLKGLK